jgi:glucose/arabinose dehydrogenase
MRPKQTALLLGLFLLILVAVTSVLAASSQPTEIGSPPAAVEPQGAPNLTAVSYVSGLSQPVAMAHAYDGRLFVVERAGRIRIIDASGNLLTIPFLDITHLVLDSPNERGLLGLAFHPDYPNTPYFYVNYTADPGGDTVVARYSVSANPNIADPNSALQILTFNQPEWNHNGGDLKFGPRDGYLYISTGDGGSGGDPWNNAQNRNTLLGKILRIDVDGGTPYAIPPDNPFVGIPNTAAEIWALGLRNPWRISFDRLNGDMYIGDVGQGAWEEVDYQPHTSSGGENYGWRCYEGNHPYNMDGCRSAGNYVFPVAEYDHPTGYAVTGGFVYRGSSYPTLQGWYVYADYATSRFWLAQPNTPNWEVHTFANIGMSTPSTFGEGCNGELYVASYGGTIYRLQTTTFSAGLGESNTFLPALLYDVQPSPTNTPPPTDTPIPPTATHTAVPPTATHTPTAIPTLPPPICNN